jgi:hypothetical protein
MRVPQNQFVIPEIAGINQPLVILSEAKDLRSFVPSKEWRTTAEILRFAQDDEPLAVLLVPDF